MHDELQTLDLFESVPSLDVPTFFFTGRHDHHVDAGVAADYFQALDAPTKRIVWFEESAHNIPFEQPDLFHTLVLELLDSGAF
ncbi:alpha/beta hydrolase [Natronospirillum operosum]|uniref:Alpha/beta hydrolase n=1 Tax=Natronospirillum operosum TaxID=2759953 RepID=A0A4Z0WG02_9GAMM|nr:alpha/beta hydrolase [Natronospirillum operosum]TGG94877.1 alpha/beta hydrolase [Natronospirillum operosum]